MLMKRNLLESLIVLCCGGSFICILLNYATNISPITGLWFPIYVILLFFVSLSCSFKLLQWLLTLNRPLKYDLEELVKDYPYLSFLSSVVPNLPKATRHHTSAEYKEYDTNELSVISTVLERKLVSSWYVPYISQEIGFPFACKQLLDQMIGKAFQICNKIDPKDLCIDVCTILTLHLREYKKAINRHEKSPTSSIVSLYKTPAPDDNYAKRPESSDHCFNVLRIIFKELVPWELWDTPHSDLLIRILSKKLDYLIDTTIADPAWLNNKLLIYLADEISVADTQVKDESAEIETNNHIDSSNQIVTSFEDILVEEQHSPVMTMETSPLCSIVKAPASLSHSVIDEELTEQGVETLINGAAIGDFVTLNGNRPLEIQGSPVLRQRRGRQGRNEVKIYDRIIEGSVKTWDTDLDLQCISLGQDLLASLDGEMTLSRLWGGEDSESTPARPDPLWFGEEDTEEPDLASAEQSSPAGQRQTSPKPAELLLKDLQSTVREAKSKIGDLQDEAAGMMEGLLDFGIAGLKKGLRFTGLSDDSQEKERSPSSMKEKHVGSGSGSSPPLEKDIGPATLLQKEDIVFVNNVPPLMKQQRVVSQDSVPNLGRPFVSAYQPDTSPLLAPILSSQTIPIQSQLEALPLTPVSLPSQQIPLPVPSQSIPISSHPISELSHSIPVSSHPIPVPPQAIPLSSQPIAVPAGDSPEPQYEEAADLSTSIAKLRSLLQQREQFENKLEDGDIWWQGAEETRGRTQQQRCSRPVDTATLADEYDMHADRNTSPNNSTNNMQRLDKLFQRTVTGVFNSIRTAVGAEGDEGGVAPPPPADREWRYVCTASEMSVGGAVARLVGSRRAYTHVDAALDSLENLPTPCAPAPLPPGDLEEWCAAEGACYSACAELACAFGLTRAHTAHRLAAALLAEVLESLIARWLEELAEWLKREVFASFERMSDEEVGAKPSATPRRPFDLDYTCDAILRKLPAPLSVFGEETLSQAVRLGVRSMSHSPLNRQLACRLLAHAACHFKNTKHT